MKTSAQCSLAGRKWGRISLLLTVLSIRRHGVNLFCQGNTLQMRTYLRITAQLM